LPGETIVEARLVNVAFEDLAIGMPLRFTLAALDDEAEQPRAIPAFEPVETAA